MTAHMLMQYTALLLAGGLLVDAVPDSGLRRLQRCNEYGIAGFVGVALAMAVLMVPRVLDLALVDMRVEAVKLLGLVSSGAALRLSWPRAGVVVQGFFLGNVLPMMAVVGTLYSNADDRVCNAYRLGDQQALGTSLVVITAGVAAAWLFQFGLRQGRA